MLSNAWFLDTFQGNAAFPGFASCVGEISLFSLWKRPFGEYVLCLLGPTERP